MKMKTSKMTVMAAFIAGAGLIISGCSDEQPTTGIEPGEGSNYVLAEEPAGALPVGDLPSTDDSSQVTLVGIVGGSREPFVDGLAAFTIVDPKVPYCGSDESCPTPWDYCCTQDQVEGNIATVTLVDDAGNVVAKNAKDLVDVQELSTVVVQGKANRDPQGNLTIAADKIHVRQTE